MGTRHKTRHARSQKEPSHPPSTQPHLLKIGPDGLVESASRLEEAHLIHRLEERLKPIETGKERRQKGKNAAASPGKGASIGRGRKSFSAARTERGRWQIIPCPRIDDSQALPSCGPTSDEELPILRRSRRVFSK